MSDKRRTKIRFASLVTVQAIGLLAGCNMITGADSLVLEDRPSNGGKPGAGSGTSVVAGTGGAPGTSDGAGAGTSDSTGFGGATATASVATVGAASTTATGSTVAVTSTASSTGSGGDVEPEPPGPQPPPAVTNAADGVALTDVKLYQAVEVSLTKPSDIPVIAGKNALVRVFYQVQSGYDGKAVTARISTEAGYAEATSMLSGASTQASLGSTLNIQVPGALLAVGGTFRVDLVQADGSGTNAAASYPQGGGMASHGAKASGQKLRVVLVPVLNGGKLPDTSPGQVQKYADQIRWQYPIPEVEVTVRAQPHTFDGWLGSYAGWSALLNEISDVRDADNVAPDIYYYGIHAASSNGLLGLGWVAGANDVWSRAAIGVGWTGDTAPETAVHELGHNHGRSHSPCGVDGDWNYPHPGAKIGVWGYNPGTNKLLDPAKYVDFMSYCDPPWVSDHTYKALFARLKQVNKANLVYPEALLNRTWDRVRILDGVATWLEPITLAVPPDAEVKTVSAETSQGSEELEGRYFAYNHLDGGVLFVLRPKWMLDPSVLRRVEFTAGGRRFAPTR